MNERLEKPEIPAGGVTHIEAKKESFGEIFVTKHYVEVGEGGITWNLDPEEGQRADENRRGREPYPTNIKPARITAQQISNGYGIVLALYNSRGKAHFIFEIASASDGAEGTILKAGARRKNR